VATKKRVSKRPLGGDLNLVRDDVIARLKRGEPILRVAKVTRVDAKTVRSWGKKAGLLGKPGERLRPAEPVPVASPAPPGPQDPPEPPARGDDLDALISIRERLRAQAAQADAEGNTAAATKYLIAAGKAGNDIARIRDGRKAPTGSITFSPEELKEAERLIDERVEKLLRSPEVMDRVCPSCGEKIRMHWASTPPPVVPTPGDKSDE